MVFWELAPRCNRLCWLHEASAEKALEWEHRVESRPCVSTFASTLEVSFKPLLAHMNCSTKAHFYRIQGHPMTKSSRKTATRESLPS